MKEKSFDWLWNQIEKSINDIEADLSKDQSYNFHRVNPSKTKVVLKSEYEQVRDNLKGRIYTDYSKGNRIDHHKIASCMCKALIQKKVFSFHIDNSISQRMLLSNYELAYIVSLRIIYVVLLEEYKANGENEYYEKLYNQQSLIVPRTSESHDPYHLGRIKTLALNDYHGIDFDVLTYADMLYWIEHYTRQLIENKIQIVPFPGEGD